AGHHPAYLVAPSRKSAVPLWSPGSLMIGAYEDAQYTASTVEIPPGSGLYVFSDGVFEVVALDGRRWELEDFVPLLTEPATAGVPESRRLLARMQRVQGRPNFEDDFTMVVASFD
ncbi:MAG: PP2C family protein-serine/threonine phosphatase, partial [Planctomycetota bacterium]|nr:PP2C family protein-serine/threonine phosphatase [Planctomycetota bacterium]